MSRLQKHQQKKYRSQIIGYLFLLLIIIVFISTIGIKLLINTSLFIIKLTQGNKTGQGNNSAETDLILPPQIFNLPDATNSAEIMINGRAETGKNLSVYVNEAKQSELTPDEDTFQTSIQLAQGANTVYLITEGSKTNEKKVSKTYTVFYKEKKPVLEITSPRDQEKTSKNEIQIIGMTDQDVVIHINNLPVIINADGQFTFSFKLKEGENHILVEAIDRAGNTESQALTVFYIKAE